jgi:tripartite-type tricarboxylate transporter receptor subunit TctC
MLRLLLFLLSLALLAAPAHAHAAIDGADYFRGKTITYIVATGAGGVYDLQARLIARYLPNQLPGVRVLVKNIPGAGHLIGTNTLAVARPDGLTIGTFNTGLIYDQLLERSGLRADLLRMSYIAKASSDDRALVIATRSGFKSFDEFFRAQEPVKFVSAGIGSASYIETRILRHVTQLPLQIVTGFEGTEGELAMMRGEVVATIGTATSLEPFVRSGNGFFGLVLTETAAYPGVPRAMTYAKDEEGRRLLRLISTLSGIGRLTAGPPGIPPAILATLRDAFAATMQDPRYLAEAGRINMIPSPAHGREVEALVRQALAQPPETVALLKRAVAE